MIGTVKKSWYKVYHNGERVGVVANVTEQEAFDRVQKRYGHLGIITLEEHPPEEVEFMNKRMIDGILTGRWGNN